ncbi:hypothetical protein KAR26_03540 [Candidatus Parcubacteria bacterium]|nr:hypothetical protein [Candidatus Parcubacteria bacterium]
MIELIAIIILICSLGILTALSIWKIPVLAQLSFDGDICDQDIFTRAKSKVKELVPSKSFNHKNFLQKILLHVRILSLKTENKTNNLIQRLSQQDRINGKDNYWEELKKTSKSIKRKRVRVKKSAE